MPARQNALNEWLSTVLPDPSYTLSPLAGDASFRRYFRVITPTTRWVVMDAPPPHESLEPFITLSQQLNQHGIHAPSVHASEPGMGFALLEDLGDLLLFNQRHSSRITEYYAHALNTLQHMQQCTTNQPTLPAFDVACMQRELQLFHTWFLDAWLNIQLTTAETACLTHTLHQLCAHLSEQPQCFMHRDFHSRNLLVLNPTTELDIGVIDFQDAVRGPFAYDLVSLTKDCYIEWPAAQQFAWVDQYYTQLPERHGWSRTEFQQAVDWCGLQRHLKVLGIFCRLHLRDHKSTYLNALPLTLTHTLTTLAQYTELHPLYDIMQQRVVHAVQAKQPA